MRAYATLARIRRHYAARLNSSVRPARAKPAIARQIAISSGNLHHASRNSHYAVSRSKAHLHRTANSFLFGTKIKVKIYSPQTSAEQEQVPDAGHPARLRATTQLSGMCAAQFRARAAGLTIRSSRHRFAASAEPCKIVPLPPPQSGAA